MTVTSESCRLCGAPAHFYDSARGRTFLQCTVCHSLQVISTQLPDADREKALYLTHENDINDARYQAFVSPVTNAILVAQTADQSGLDFGAGPGPAITHQLQQQGYNIALFDPFFHNNISVLEVQYDFIFSCEVIEHFHQPAIEFSRLRSLLKADGNLYCMTEFFSESLDFQRWYYKNDPTHVFFYHADSLPLIQETFGFKTVRRDDRLAVFSI